MSGFDEQLRPTGEFGLGEDPVQDLDDTMPAHVVLDRHALRTVLLDGLDGAVEFGRRCVVTARFADGDTAQGTVLVAADGIGSVIRAQLFPHARVVDSGARLIYGRVPLTPELRAALPPAMFSVFNSVSGPDKRFLGIAPVEYRERPSTATARLAPRLDLGAMQDSLAVMFGRRRESLGLSDEELVRGTGHPAARGRAHPDRRMASPAAAHRLRVGCRHALSDHRARKCPPATVGKPAHWPALRSRTPCGTTNDT